MRNSIKGKYFWDEKAANYDSFMDEYAGLYAKIITAISNELEPHYFMLDMATGTGKVAIELNKQVRHIVGIDFSRSMIAIAYKKARLSNTLNVEFAVQNGSSLGFKDDLFDAVTCVSSLHVLQDIPGSLCEIKRVLKPGGKFMAVDPLLNRSLKSLIAWVIKLLQGQTHHCFGITSFSKLIEKSGFEITKRDVIKVNRPVGVVVSINPD